MASGFLAIVGGLLIAPSNPTCNDNTYDYYVISKTLNRAVVGVQRVDGIGMNPHRPACLLLRGGARRFAVRPARVPAKLPMRRRFARPRTLPSPRLLMKLA